MPGYLQRLELDRCVGEEGAADANDDTEDEESPLRLMLLELFVAGHMSATAVQKLSHAAILSGLTSSDVASLAVLGAVGHQPGNISRDLMRSLNHGNDLPAPFRVKVPCIDPGTEEYCVADAYVMLPHRLLAALPSYEEYDAAIRPDLIPGFWDNVEKTGDPRLTRHPMTATASWKTTYIPGYLHGDGVEFVNGDSLMVYHWGSLLNTAPSMTSCFLLAAWPKSCTTKAKPGEPGTWEVLLQVICWSLQACFAGTHPDIGPFGEELPADMKSLAGRPLVDGSDPRLTIWQILGDHEFFSNELKLPHWNCHDVCWLCTASSVDANRDFKELRSCEIGWVMRDIEVELASPISQHEFFRLPGVTCWSVALDALHILYTNGVFARLLGSYFHEVVYPNRGDRRRLPATVTLSRLWMEISQEYRAQKSQHRLTKLKLGMFVNVQKIHTRYPHFSGKAAETRELLQVVAAVVQRNCSNTLHDMHRAACFKCFVDFDNTISNNARDFLPAEQGMRACRKLHQALEHYSWLNAWAEERSKLLYPITIKFHTSYHLGQMCKYHNPRLNWTFKCEDFVGRLAKLGHSVCFGLKATQLTTKLFPKYCVQLHFLMSHSFTSTV